MTDEARVLKLGAGTLYVLGEDGRWHERGQATEVKVQIASADYSQIERRIMAHISEDETLIGSAGLGNIEMTLDTANGVVHFSETHSVKGTLSITYATRRFTAIRPPKKEGAQWKRERKGRWPR